MKLSILLASAIAIPLGAQAASASSSDWHEAEGAKLRIVTSGFPDGDGVLKGALQIDLASGWKTYWRDPGESGVPPTVEITGAPGVRLKEMSFPAPRRFDDGYSVWAGYKQAVSLPLEIIVPEDADGPLTANVFIGVCETICIPVQARLEIDPASEPANPEHASVVLSAFRNLPGPAGPELHAAITGENGPYLTLEAVAPEGAEVEDLFVAGTSGLVLGMAKRVAGSDRDFKVKVLDRPKDANAEPVFYTLVTSAGTVSGTLREP